MSILGTHSPAHPPPRGRRASLRSLDRGGAGTAWIQIERRNALSHPARAGEQGLSALAPGAQRKIRAARLQDYSLGPEGTAFGAQTRTRTLRGNGWHRASPLTPAGRKGMIRKIQAGLFSFLLIFVIGRNLRAQGPPAHPLALGEAIDYALAHYPAVLAALEQVESARSGVALARTSYLPQLNTIYQANRATQNQVNGI